MGQRYIIFCDESDAKGRFYSNFYGGALIRANDQRHIEDALQQKKNEIHVFEGEMKWEKISEAYVQKYISYIDLFFDLVESGHIKLRILFTQNRNLPNLQDYQIGNDYFMLYYQFIKHAFGLEFSTENAEASSAMVLLDDVPSNKEKLNEFKGYLSSLSSFPRWTRARFSISYEDITDVNSKQHNIMQGLDIVLGAVQSRLNEKHTRPIPPAKRRSKRARAKEKVYKHIYSRIRMLRANFNVGISTGQPNGPKDRFHDPYRHWLFVPNDIRVDGSMTKKAAGVRK